MNILYVGPNNSEWAQYNRPVSLAAAKWSRGFLSALSRVSHLTVVTHSHEHIWPHGGVFWRGYDKRLYPDAWECVAISYPSLFKIRELWLNLAYPRAVGEVLNNRRIDVALLYNCHIPYMLQSLKELHARGVPCYPIILDGDDPRKDNWKWIKRAAEYSTGFIPLSWWIYENLPKHITGKRMYHMDGGADEWRGVFPRRGLGNRNYKLVHTGALDQWRGLDFMVKLVKQMTSLRKDIKFILCGKSSEKELKDIFSCNPYVELPGFVTEDEMVQICNSADVLLNVRNPAHPDNVLNYPSKLPHYLSFGRPIVSTRLLSLSPDYGEVVNFPEDDTIEAYIAKVNEVLTWDYGRREKAYKSIKEWFLRRKCWDVLAKGLVEWLNVM